MSNIARRTVIEPRLPDFVAHIVSQSLRRHHAHAGTERKDPAPERDVDGDIEPHQHRSAGAWLEGLRRMPFAVDDMNSRRRIELELDALRWSAEDAE